MCKSRDPFFYTGVIVRARWRASLRDARCARYYFMIDTAVHVSNVAYEPLVFDCTKTTTDNLARLLLSK